MDKELEKLYSQKGQLITSIEVSQAQLKPVTDRIVQILNKQIVDGQEAVVNTENNNSKKGD